MSKLLMTVIFTCFGMQLKAMQFLPRELQSICRNTKYHGEDYHCRLLKDIFDCARLKKANPNSWETAAICSERVELDPAWELSYHVNELTKRNHVENAIYILEQTRKNYEQFEKLQKNNK